MVLSRTRTQAARLSLSPFENRIVPAVLLVDDDNAQFANATYHTIQAAVNAAHSGDTIKVAAGFYVEQVTIPGTKDNLTLKSAQPNLAVIQSPQTLTGSKAIVTIDGASHVTIRGFTITGPSPDLDFGVQVTGGGSASIQENLITAIRGATLSGTQTGIGVVIGGSGGAKGSAVVWDNVITDYQKGGVIVANAGSQATIEDNRIVGSGPTDLIAQNGVQVSDGAKAIISENFIAGNVYTGDGTEAAGIVTSDSGTIVIRENRLVGNQDGLLIEGGSGISILNNRIEGSALDGIVLNEVSSVIALNNRVTGSGRDGINIADSTLGVFVGNTVKNNGRDGLHIEGLSKNLVIFGNTLRGNASFDASDDTTGSGSGGTANLWFGNSIGTRNRPGLK